MKKILQYLVIVLASALGTFLAVILLNYFNRSVSLKADVVKTSETLSPTVSVMSWNIGYAGLGEESDFVMDGGENLLPPSKEVVEKNLAGIKTVLLNHKMDVYLIQEISKPDMLNYGVNVWAGVKTTLSAYSSWFSYDFHTVLVPKKWSLKHGLAMFTCDAPDSVEIVRLPNEPTRLGKVVERQYHIQVASFPDSSGKWAFFNIHLSAFDEDGKTRIKQLDMLGEIAQDYYAQGYHVVIGGDWNMQLTPTDFPNTTNMKDLFWLKKLPKDKLPKDWTLVFDKNVPTVRTNYQPFVKGENYTTIIDGFLISPNVEVVAVKTLNTEFKYTDHQPVIAKFMVKTK